MISHSYDPSDVKTTAPQGACPFHAASESEGAIAPGVELVLPQHRSTVVQYAKNPSGVKELRLYYGDKEISFDEPELFAFGETLAKQSRFVAASATKWGTGYGWKQVQELLGQLVDAGVLMRADEVDATAAPQPEIARTSPLPPATCAVARSWTECESITGELAGLPVEIGHLEMVIPIFRVAHIALDADGRQVGEANVFPRALRVDVPTDWKTCNLPGTRHQVDRPMNVTAMKAMRQHWPQMMAALLRVREAYLRRFPGVEKAWTVGHLERLATMVLAVPTFQLMRRDGALANGEMHSALSCMFRVTDGLRMTMHQMLFVPIGEPTLPPDAPMDVDTILDYAERNFSYHSDTGVCAGPQAMVREFLTVLIEGRVATDYGRVALEPAVADALADVEDALDYGFAGLQVYAAVFSLWPAMTRAYEQIAAALALWSAGATADVAVLRARMDGHLERMRKGTFLGSERWRADRDLVFADMFTQCGRALAGSAHAVPPATWSEPSPTSQSSAAAARLRAILAFRLGPVDARDGAALGALADAVMDFLLREQAILRTATAAQATINRVLGRAQPTRAFGAAEADIHNLIQGAESRRLPYLIDELRDLLGIVVEVTADHIEIKEQAVSADA